MTDRKVLVNVSGITAQIPDADAAVAVGGAKFGSAGALEVGSDGDLDKIKGVAYSWPGSQGAASTVLTNDGSGNLSWAAGGGGGGMSIGGTVTGGTAGSVLFVGTGPVLAQDNANLFWDDANNRLGINTATPAATVEIAAGTTTIPALQISSTSSGAANTTALTVSVTSGTTGGTDVGVSGSISGASTVGYTTVGAQGINGTTQTILDQTLATGGGPVGVRGIAGGVNNSGRQATTGPLSPACRGNTAVFGYVANSVVNIGVGGSAPVDKANATNVGVAGRASNDAAGTAVRIGGLFSVGLSSPAYDPEYSQSAALIADNINTTDPIFVGRDNGTAVLTIGDNGTFLSKNTANSTTAFQVQNAAGTTVLDVDTTNQRVGIGTATPTHLLSVGAASELAVGTDGDLDKIKNVSYSWPSSQGSAGTALTNDGSGNLSWSAAVSIAPITTISTGTTLDSTYYTVLCNGTFTVTLPAAANNTGRVYNVKNIGVGTVTVDGNGAETIDGAATYPLSTQYQTVTIQCDGTAWFIL